MGVVECERQTFLEICVILVSFLLGLFIHALIPRSHATASSVPPHFVETSATCQPRNAAPSEPAGLTTTSGTETPAERSADDGETETQKPNTALVSTANAPKHHAIAMAHPPLFTTPLVLTAEPRPPFRPNLRSLTQIPTTSLPPWEVAFETNVKNSRLLHLPEEILLLILQLADIPDLYMWRQVSFTFWRIYQSKYFRNFHRDGKLFYEIEKEGLKGFEHDEETKKRARDQAYCDKCIAKTQSKKIVSPIWSLQFKTLYCSFCRRDHPRSWFSHKERQKKYVGLRCVSWEGHFRVCPHETVSMPLILQYVDRIGIAGKDRHTYHDIVICQVCQAVAGKLAGEDIRTRNHITPPKVSLVNAGPDYRDRPQVMFLIDWTLPVFEIPEDRGVTYLFLLQRLREFEKTYGDMLCPHLPLERLLAPFDSRLCVCLGGDRRIGGISPCERNIDWVDKHHPARGCKRKGATRISGVFLSQDDKYPVKHEVTCRDYCGNFIWTRKDRFVFLSRHTASLVHEEGTGRPWYAHANNLLEPQSYGAKDDIEAKHVLWCDDKTCKNGRKWKDSRH
ncbi:hypothetical protein CGCSCA4_v003751 [Colletotrichum siamense]|uniref:F-box domain-containing protein n=1 Tax=Colletotrichum siamense TaxID=690259 RepID=A0A9P5K6R3_COLSI|nr:hypothetical protein CGCSCA4_v003751 [Colletotrichum siamense]KAF4862450.1 hypothetical protein CGCSCA2_v003497 [Colletotrichum siamense]